MLPTPSWLRFGKSRETRASSSNENRIGRKQQGGAGPTRGPLGEPDEGRLDEQRTRLAGSSGLQRQETSGKPGKGPSQLESGSQLNVNKILISPNCPSLSPPPLPPPPASRPSAASTLRPALRPAPIGSHEGPSARYTSQARVRPSMRKTLVGFIQRALSPISAGTSGGRRSQAAGSKAADAGPALSRLAETGGEMKLGRADYDDARDAADVGRPRPDDYEKSFKAAQQGSQAAPRGKLACLSGEGRANARESGRRQNSTSSQSQEGEEEEAKARRTRRDSDNNEKMQQPAEARPTLGQGPERNLEQLQEMDAKGDQFQEAESIRGSKSREQLVHQQPDSSNEVGPDENRPHSTQTQMGSRNAKKASIRSNNDNVAAASAFKQQQQQGAKNKRSNCLSESRKKLLELTAKRLSSNYYSNRKPLSNYYKLISFNKSCSAGGRLEESERDSRKRLLLIQCCLTAKTNDKHNCAIHGPGSCPPAGSGQLENLRAPARREFSGNGKRLGSSAGRGFGMRSVLKKRKLPACPSSSIPTWPIEKQILNDNSNFGDCEHLYSRHLNGHLYKIKFSKGARKSKELFGGEKSIGPNGIAQESPNDGRPIDFDLDLEFDCDFGLDPDFEIESSNNGTNVNGANQKTRSFGQSFERPTTGWIHNATRPEKINQLESLKAKLFAANGFRRGSYDEQEGDNDINIILQPSDLHEIEKRARKLNYIKNNNNIRSSFDWELNNNLNDLKLAKCLLDQDYNLTVRLFISKSALNWNFNSFTFDALCCGRSLTELLLYLFDYYNLYKIFNLNIINVLKCFKLLEFSYHSTNPYHNSIHAADVTQAMHCFIQENKIKKHMTHLETLSSILAAVCHDLDHPGVNQSFLVATKNPLANLYNNESVLENHHWRFALCIFKESQLFDHFDTDVYNKMKTQMKHLILATDIARQNDYLRRFRELTSSQKFSMQNTDHRALVLQMALKCADLGNPCRPWLISRVWSNLICDEFYKMGRIERRLGIPLTPICQREKTSIAGIQTDFFRYIVLPLLDLWHKFLQSPLSSLLMSNFEHNYKRWQKANIIIQQLRRRKSVACLNPIYDETIYF